jgi:hypothetical protein
MNITGFNPTSGGDQTPVTIQLTGMPADSAVENTTVMLSGSASVSVNAVDPTAGTVDVTIESNAQSGEFVVLVNSVAGYADAQSAQTFDVQGAAGEPRITGLIPTPTTANSQVTLNGQNLTGARFVRVGSATVMSLSVSANAIRFRLPATVQPGTYRVTVNYEQYGTVNCPRQLTVAAVGAEVAS